MRGSASHPIRKGWPEDLSNTFVGEEIEQAALTLHPAQAAAEGATRERLERIGGHGALIIDWLDAAPLDAVAMLWFSRYGDVSSGATRPSF